MEDTPRTEAFRIGDWLVQPSRNLLVRDGTVLRARPKVMDVLAVLAEHGNEVVPGEVLQQRVWGKRFLARTALSGTICELRELLGDDRLEPTYVETVPKRGYRLVAPVTREECEPEGLGGSRAIPTRSGVMRRLVLVSMVVIVTGVAVTATLTHRRGTRPDPPPRLAVLPFSNLGVPEDEFLARGIADEIATRLASLDSLRVVSRNSVERAISHGEWTAASLGKQLDIEFVVDGTVRWNRGDSPGDRLRVTSRLIRTDDGSVVWADVYEGTTRDVLSFQARIGDAVREQLAPVLTPTPSDEADVTLTSSHEAYLAVLRANEFLHHGDSSEQVVLARELYRKALDLDPAYLAAAVGIAHADTILYSSGYDRTKRQLHAALEAVGRAATLSPSSDSVRLVRAHALAGLREDLPGALAQLEAGSASLQRNIAAAQLKSAVLLRLGRHREAVKALLTASETNPNDPHLLFAIGSIEVMTGDFTSGRDHCRRSSELAPDQEAAFACAARAVLLGTGSARLAKLEIDRMPNLPRASVAAFRWLLDLCDHDYQAALSQLADLPESGLQASFGSFPRRLLEGETLLRLDRTDEAAIAFRDAREYLAQQLGERPEDPRVLCALAVATAHSGDPLEARRIGQRALERCPLTADASLGSVIVTAYAGICLRAGDPESAVEALRTLLGTPVHQYWLRLISLDPRWETIWEHPGFKELEADSNRLAHDLV